jgi:hypothetical protein
MLWGWDPWLKNVVAHNTRHSHRIRDLVYLDKVNEIHPTASDFMYLHNAPDVVV